ncbi:MAG TPA: 50S ribosomal protein L4 [Nitrospinae bacterium]|uniref:Large ribosomal subunit protein uL4 n=1 Tax=uncultured bacterium Rifle_16ft_4_minimus_4190 TaxID=1665159 RepID=A0A0H4T8I4_9BACT|nr:50S ribosomal protein L4, large subunit ribosomal protein L4 [uncultured bacterium Rifle_16ft_4_minimus_4190]HAP66303.1 50S ribosomal protein L4 [Nitrospinota bacterium]
MSQLNVLDMNNKVVGKVSLKEDIFNSEIKEHLLHKSVIAHLANLRRGTHSTKIKSEVRGGGAKPWRQKGTGRARAGSIRSPLWRGGGITFGPKPRDYDHDVPKKMRRSALISALSLKVKNGDIFVVDKIDIDKPKTKDVVSILKNFKIDRSVLFLIDEKNMNLELSARNIPDARVQRVDSINVYDLLYYDKIICTKGAIDKIQTTMKQAQGKAQE